MHGPRLWGEDRRGGAPFLVFVAAPPASGKSTVCGELMAMWQARGMTATYISESHITEETITADHTGEKHRVLGEQIVFGEDTLREIHRALAQRVMAYRGVQYILIELGPGRAFRFAEYYDIASARRSILVTVDSDLSTCLQRNRERAQLHPEVFNAYVPEQFILGCFERKGETSDWTNACLAKLTVANYGSMQDLRASAHALADRIISITSTLLLSRQSLNCSGEVEESPANRKVGPRDKRSD